METKDYPDKKRMYFGKSLDTFEYAISFLLEAHTGQRYDDVDCMALRCFAFQIPQKVSEWFHPVIQIKQAVEALNKYLNGIFACRAVSSKYDLPDATYFAVGPVQRGLSAKMPQELLYFGAEKYMYAERIDENCYSVTDPAGVPGILLTGEELMRLLKSESSMAIWIPSEYRKEKIPQNIDKQLIWKNGLAYFYEKKVQMQAECNHVFFPPGEVRKYHSHIMQCAVMNLLIQWNKTIMLAASADADQEKICDMVQIMRRKIYYTSEEEILCFLRNFFNRMFVII